MDGVTAHFSRRGSHTARPRSTRSSAIPDATSAPACLGPCRRRAALPQGEHLAPAADACVGDERLRWGQSLMDDLERSWVILSLDLYVLVWFWKVQVAHSPFLQNLSMIVDGLPIRNVRWPVASFAQLWNLEALLRLWQLFWQHILLGRW